VVSLEPPIRQGHTSYPHVVIQIAEDEMIEAELNISPEYLAFCSIKKFFLNSCSLVAH
jgi:hypothetical protein